MTFEEAYDFTRHISSETAYHKAELELLWETVMRVPQGGAVAEVGCEYGRSTSLLLQASKHLSLNLTLIDNFVDPAPAPRLMATLLEIGYPFNLFVGTTPQASHRGVLPPYLDLVHIDGDHSERGLGQDFSVLLWRTRTWVVLHDWGRDSLPDVYKVSGEWLTPKRWEQTGVAGTCAVWRRLR